MSDASDAPAPAVSVIAHPLADDKLSKKVLKVVKKGACRAAARCGPPSACCGCSRRALESAFRKQPTRSLHARAASKAKSVRRGVKEVVKALRKKPAGCAARRVACARVCDLLVTLAVRARPPWSRV